MSDPSDLTVSQAREIVLEIAEGKGWVEPRIRNKTDPDTLRLLKTIAKIREDLGDAVETIARDIGSRKARFILEMIQNAEDNKFTKTNKMPSISFEVFRDRIIVECNEDGFIQENVESICRTGRSSKKASRGGYIGEKGIGFKSVFQVASKVHIQSNAFSFSFRYDGGDTSEEKLGIVTPIPEDEVLPPHEWPLTRMTLTTLDSISYDDLVDQFNAIPDNLILFLSTLEKLKITIHDCGQTTSVTTFQKTEEAGTGLVKLIKTVENPDDRNASDVTVTQYRIVKRELSNLPVDRQRPDIHECEVVLAFPVTSGHPLISSQNVFAFLPIRSFGFSFLIQADFIVEASRQDVVDSPRNKAILNGVAETFRDAVLEFCSVDSPLRYQWMRYLPATEGRDSFWTVLSSGIVRLLREECIIFPYMSLEARKPHQLRILPTTHVDTEGLPLFQDLSDHPVYLLLSYESTDIKILEEAFGIRKIGDELMYKRIENDLGNRHSRMMTTGAEEDWHGLAADLIMSICSRQASLRERFTTLPLIPLMDGRWASSADQEIYFPSRSGVAIPTDLVDTVHPSAVKIHSRQRLFAELGVLRCSTEFVIGRIWEVYLTRGGASDLSLSKAHLSYLYWNNEDIQHSRYQIIWVYDDENKKVTSRRKVIYFQSDNQYSAKQLLKATSHPRNPARIFHGCLVPVLHPDYMDLFPPSTRRSEVSWLDWLEKSLGVRYVPRLKSDGGSLSQEFRHIIARQPRMLVGTLKEYWNAYKMELTPPISQAISQAEVVCSGSRALRKLGSTYMPLPFLKDAVQALGLSRGFPFLEVGGDLDEHNLRRDWIFLEEFGVGFGDDLAFYVEVVRQHEALTQRQWDTTAQANIMKSYEAIADHQTGNDTEWLRQVFDDDDVSLILHPVALFPSSHSPSWTDIRSCVWQGPKDILDREPLALVPQYKNSEKISHFFTQVLGIRDATWEDYIRVLSTLKGNSENSTTAQDISEKVLRLYYLLSEVDHVGDRSAIRAIFEEDQLVYMPGIDGGWFPPSNCLWDSPVPIDGNAIIVNSYAEDLKGFFVESLGVSPATLDKLVLELELLAERDPSVQKVTQLIWAINEKKPEKGDLDRLLAATFLPIKLYDVDAQRFTRVLRSTETDFAIIDNMSIARNFEHEKKAKFLDFTLEEVLQLHPFLTALSLEDRYISKITYEDTACADVGEDDRRLTYRFRARAHELLRCAFFYQSPTTKTDPQSLYDLLLSTSIKRSDRISTKHTLCLGSEDIQVYGPTGYIHIATDGNSLQLFVPLNNKHRELCYLTNLPQALAILLQIDLSARNIIQKVLTSSAIVLEDLLDAEGIGRIQSIPAPSRNREQHDSYDDDDEDGEERVLPHEEIMANSPIPMSQSTPPRVSRDMAVRYESQARSAVEIWNARSRSNSPMAHYHDTPAGSQFGESDAGVTPSPDRHFSRSPTPEQANVGRSAGYIRLLDHVIRMSTRFVFPHHDTVPQAGYGGIYQGFDHQATFGIRSQGQMSHDIKIGAAGELYVFEILSSLLSNPGGNFGRENWKSGIRNEVTVHPNYIDMEPWLGAETADIVFSDSQSILTEMLVHGGYLDDIWIGTHPRYFIEVKTTTGEWDDRFFMSNSQFLRMQCKTLTPGRIATDVYVIFRVYHLTKDDMGIKIYVDPEADRRSTNLVFAANSWTVKQRA